MWYVTPAMNECITLRTIFRGKIIIKLTGIIHVRGPQTMQVYESSPRRGPSVKLIRERSVLAVRTAQGTNQNAPFHHAPVWHLI